MPPLRSNEDVSKLHYSFSTLNSPGLVSKRILLYTSRTYLRRKVMRKFQVQSYIFAYIERIGKEPSGAGNVILDMRMIAFS